ncbi:hypothetical protein [Parageobacillus thermoglucosidasius]|nr:hypothetical protein [Parageobacillus thermoglucosidasius]MED4903414.1 hypothetical protein [Parageobacillus thermoglucosidasius]MED4912877.1 hypothetical protein [Parageobacillus thermoglucosidasius]MED4945267.1 hypothetical protein [Parageobacillus thermoglucosidasius]MED4984529.1 hypothetical protein [Parageobacillus thermoglucosidasius]
MSSRSSSEPEPEYSGGAPSSSFSIIELLIVRKRAPIEKGEEQTSSR